MEIKPVAKVARPKDLNVPETEVLPLAMLVLKRPEGLAVLDAKTKPFWWSSVVVDYITTTAHRTRIA